MELYEREGGRLKVNMHPGQLRAWDSTARFVLVSAGTQSGKTSFEPLWLQREIEERGPGDYIASSATYDLFALKLLPEMVRFFCDWTQWGTYKAADRVILSNTGASDADKSRIILRSALSEERTGGLESATAKAAVLDEWGLPQVPLSAWEAVQRRLSIAQGRVLFGTTPYTLGWLKQQVYDRWVGGDPDYDVIQFASIENPAFPREEYERARRTLPDWRFRMMYNGEFVRPAGLIYDCFIDSYADVGGHLVKPFPIPVSWQRIVGIDFGLVNTGLVWLAERPDAPEHYIYRTALGGGLTGPEHAKAALEYNEPVRRWLGGAKSEEQARMEWRRAGCPVIQPFITDLEPAIDHVTGLFKQNRAFVFDTLHDFRSEIGTYSRELDDAGEPTEKIKDKEKFHLLDALRAGCSAIPLERKMRRPQEDEAPPPGRSRKAIQARRRYGEPVETEEYV